MKRYYSYSEARALRLNKLSYPQREEVRRYRAEHELRADVLAPLAGLVAFAIGGLGFEFTVGNRLSDFWIRAFLFTVFAHVAGYGTYFWIINTIPSLFMPARPKDYRGPVDGLTTEVWNGMLQRWGDSCAYCGRLLSGYGGGTTHREHVVPLSRGGPNKASNIVPACRDCNLSKHTETGAEYLDRRRRAGLSINPDWQQLRPR